MPEPELPELAGLHTKVTLNYLLNTFFRGRGPRKLRTSILVRRFIILVDQVVHEYGLARERLTEYHTTSAHVLSPLLRASGHVENCLNALRRALRFAKAIRRDRDGPPVPKAVAAILQIAYDRVTPLRNAAEHMDELILAGKLPDGAAMVPVLQNGQIELAEATIEFGELRTWVVAVHNVAVAFADWRDPSGS